MPGWATQVFSREYDEALKRLPPDQQVLIQSKITDMGQRLATFPHYRMAGRPEYRLRVGDYRVIYRFSVEAGEIQLITLGHRRRFIVEG